MNVRNGSMARGAVRIRAFFGALYRALRGRLSSVDQSEGDVAYIDSSGSFDREWYLARYADVAASGMDPIQHYVRHGAAEGRDPAGGFSTDFYLQSNPDVRALGINPFRHYLEYGLREGRRPLPDDLQSGVLPVDPSQMREDVLVIAKSGMFDSDHYLTTYPDVAGAGMDPIEHYVFHGVSEGRCPRADFDTWFYIRENPDLGAVNPFRHYVERGRAEGRATVPAERRDIATGPLVSIVVPVYAVEEYLADCLGSIVGQSYRNLEVIVVDDGSPDGSYEIANSFAKADPRIRILRRENGGLGAARNTGVEAARGQYLTFVDSDDIVPRDAIARMVCSLQKTGSDFVVGAIRRLKGGRVMPRDGWVRLVHAQDRLGIRLGDFPQILTDVFACNKLFDADFFRREVGRFPERIRYEDQEPSAQAYRRGVFDVLCHTVYYWRIREDGTSITQNKSNPDDLRDRMIVKRRVARILSEESESIYQSWLAKAIGFDLRSYFEQVPRTDQEFFDQLREGMLPFADQMTPEIWQRVRIIDRLPALSILAGSRDDTIAAVTRRAEYGYFVPGRIDGGEAYLDRCYLEGMSLQLEDDLIKFGDADLTVTASLTSLNWEEGCLRVEGYAYLANIGFESDFWIRARLVSGDNEGVVIHVHRRELSRLDLESGDSWNSQAKSGFAVDIDPVALRLDPRSVWRVEVTVGCPRLSLSRNAVIREVDARSVSGSAVGAVLQDGSRWVAGAESDAGFTLECVPSSGCLVNGLELKGGDIEISVLESDAEALVLVCDTLRRRVEVKALTVEADGAVFRFALPDLSRDDGGEHFWHMYVRGEGVARKLVWGGDIASLQKSSQEHRRVRAVMGRRGVLTLAQSSWYAVAEAIEVDASSIVVRGRVDVVGAIAISARLVGEGQKLAADVFEFDEIAQRFSLRILFDPAAAGCNDAALNRLQGGARPSLLHGASLRLSVLYPDRRVEGWLRVSRDLQKKFPLDSSASRYGVTFTRTPRDSALWVQFRAPYGVDERGRLAQRRLHALYWHQSGGGRNGRLELEDAVLFESFGGRQVSDSVLAICNEILRRGQDLSLYWTVSDMGMPVPEGTTPLLIHSRRWMQQLRRSRYLVNNNNFPFYFRKSPGQVYLQTWHGTPLKRIGEDVPSANLSLPYRQLMKREARYWDFLLAQNDYASEVLPRAFGFSGEMLNVGYPRNDVLVGRGASVRRLAVRNLFGFESYHFVVLYAPTWRDNHSDAKGYRRVAHLDADRLCSVLGGNARVMLRGHHNTVSSPAVRRPGVVDVTHHPDINDLVLASDLLVTDYSSVMFDYVVTGKPVVFLAPDIEEYRVQTRGFYLDLEEVAPGPVCHDNDELLSVLSSLGVAREEFSGRYREFVDRFAPRDDGGAAARVVDAVWGKGLG